MPIKEHLKQLDGGLDTWNRWRANNSDDRPDFSGANLSRAKLNGVFLSDDEADPGFRIVCIFMNLGQADFRGADLSEADFRGADLSGADLSGADLTKASFFGSHLTRANLTKANLSGADLTGADLTGADLTGADLSGTIMPKSNY